MISWPARGPPGNLPRTPSRIDAGRVVCQAPCYVFTAGQRVNFIGDAPRWQQHQQQRDIALASSPALAAPDEMAGCQYLVIIGSDDDGPAGPDRPGPAEAISANHEPPGTWSEGHTCSSDPDFVTFLYRFFEI